MAKREGEGERANYLPSPLTLFRLRQFGDTIYRLTGHRAYLVGSALRRPDYRDVDVRIMVDEPDFERLFGGDGLWITNPSLTLANMALSALAREMTGGLDVDCQVQRIDDANAAYGGAREPLMLPRVRRAP